jgi:hypothetical protein
MSSENIENNNVIIVDNKSKRVDINHLIARARQEKKRDNKVNFISFGIFFSLVILVITFLTI